MSIELPIMSKAVPGRLFAGMCHGEVQRKNSAGFVRLAPRIWLPRLLRIFHDCRSSVGQAGLKWPQDADRLCRNGQVGPIAHHDSKHCPARKTGRAMRLPRHLRLPIALLLHMRSPVQPNAETGESERDRRYDRAIARDVHSALPSRRHQTTASAFLQGGRAA